MINPNNHVLAIISQIQEIAPKFKYLHVILRKHDAGISEDILGSIVQEAKPYSGIVQAFRNLGIIRKLVLQND